MSAIKLTELLNNTSSEHDFAASAAKIHRSVQISA
jgi:hypothetical protein